MIFSATITDRQIKSLVKDFCDIFASNPYIVLSVCHTLKNLNVILLRFRDFLVFAYSFFFVMKTEHLLLNSLCLFVHSIILFWLRYLWILSSLFPFSSAMIRICMLFALRHYNTETKVSIWKNPCKGCKWSRVRFHVVCSTRFNLFLHAI